MKSCGKEILLKLFWIASFGMLSGSHFNNNQQSDQTSLRDTIQTTEIVPYKTDTLDTNPKAVMYYKQNQIIRNYVDNNNKYQMRLSLFAHENWHRHNHKYKYAKNSNMTPYEYFKLCAWDEISANICGALTARFEYLYSNNPDSVLNKYTNAGLCFYIDEKELDKVQTYAENISDEECKLLFENVVTKWTTNYFKLYRETHENMVVQHFNKNNFFITKPSLYTKLRDRMLNIGGINFAAFLDKDIELYDRKIFILEQMSRIQILENIWQPVSDKIIENYACLSQMNEIDRKRVLWNIVASEKLKHMLEFMNITDVRKNKSTIQKTYDIIIQEMITDYNFNVWVSNFSPFTMQQTNIQKPDYIIKQAYKYHGVYLSNIIDTENNFWETSYIKAWNKLFLLNNPLLDFSYSNQKKQPLNSGDSVATQRRSETQYIDLPNFYMPILRNPTKYQQDEIRKIIIKYENMPAVLKECDTQAQIAYLEQQQR